MRNKKQRRILKKFGAGGHALGADEDTKVKLEGGVTKKSKPRVAGSARGRELRAAAALARFEPVKKEEIVTIKEESESETEDEYDIDERDAAVDIDGTRLRDDKGRPLVKICEEEDGQDGNAKREMEEIHDIGIPGQGKSVPKDRNPAKPAISKPTNSSKGAQRVSHQLTETPNHVIHLDEIHKRRPDMGNSSYGIGLAEGEKKNQMECSVCSLMNEQGSLLCMACANVLNPRLAPDHWRCRSATCKDTKYINSGDAGICGLCGSSRKAS